MQQHICFDLETLGNGPTAPIIQIGAVKFDVEKGIYDTFIQNIGYPYGIGNDYKMDYSTIMWWMEITYKTPEAFHLLKLEQTQLMEGLRNFTNWIGNKEDYLYWSMATFDAPILQHALRTEFGKSINEIPFRNFRDFRTAMDVVGEYMPFEGTKHYALDDAINEAKHIIKYLKIINYEITN